MKPHKLFISHASEDKDGFVQPLAEALRNEGFEVWYDRFVLTIGDSLLRKISDGLNQCDFGIVVLSRHFFSKKWPQAELDGLFSIETAERKVILPIWKDVTEADVKAFSPIISTKLAAMASHGVSAVVDEIKRAIDTARTVAMFSAIENATSRFRDLDQQVAGSLRAKNLAGTEEGITIVRNAVESALAQVESHLAKISEESETIKFNIDKDRNWHLLRAWGPYSVSFVINYRNTYSNSLKEACMYIAFSKPEGYGHRLSAKDVISEYEFVPGFDNTLKLVWKDSERAITTEQLPVFILDALEQIIAKAYKASE